jgi:hypothetical protein
VYLLVGKGAPFQPNLRLQLFPRLRPTFQFQRLCRWMGRANPALLPKNWSFLPSLLYLL